ncbi:methylated-DNA--[protein]-cysteine S-methyltransferase [Streptococcus infantis]|jgi:methylated-DNA--[protein]-cysteine S-methyltransferase|uniref:methylated-DNA--[protein]-cysteine S-methyltransferase n=1 Tax=Streptococcus infantis TaxID=68892 RepID=UPI003562E412
MKNKFSKIVYTSPIGLLSIVATDQYLFGIWVEGQNHFERGLIVDNIEEVKTHPVLNQAISYLDDYFLGQNPSLSELPLAPIGTDFEKKVWSYLQEIPFGTTVTYGQIAKDLSVASAQAVGGAVGRNPWSILVPCHRVLGANKRLTGYAAGLERKAWLLNHERADYKY